MSLTPVGVLIKVIAKWFGGRGVGVWVLECSNQMVGSAYYHTVSTADLALLQKHVVY